MKSILACELSVIRDCACDRRGFDTDSEVGGSYIVFSSSLAIVVVDRDDVKVICERADGDHARARRP